MPAGAEAMERGSRVRARKRPAAWNLAKSSTWNYAAAASTAGILGCSRSRRFASRNRFAFRASRSAVYLQTPIGTTARM